MRRYLLVVVLGTGCYHPSAPAGAPCSSLGKCPSGLTCIDDLCQVPGTQVVDAAIDACPVVSCLGNDLAGCGSRITCALGCADGDATIPAHCMELVPSNGITTALLVGATADVSGLDYHFNTDTGEVTRGGNTVVRTAGPGVISGIGFTKLDQMGVFSAHSFDVQSGTGSADDWDLDGGDSIVLFAATTINVQGIIDGGANTRTGGPGGADGATTGSTGPTCRGKAGLWQAAGFGEGGGGAGGRTAGGNGAVSTLTTFGTGGPSCSTSPTTIPLRGGNGGGAAGVDTATSPDTVHGGEGGGGGGGLALVAMESITISGSVAVPGGGGLTGTTGDGGGGGGGGGAILVESPVVTISGDLIANGGGGAGPSINAGSAGHVTDGNPANGGTYLTASGGKGGTGSALPTNGSTYSDLPVTTARGGGGGGAAGRTEIKARSRTTTGATLSPSPALSDVMLR